MILIDNYLQTELLSLADKIIEDYFNNLSKANKFNSMWK